MLAFSAFLTLLLGFAGIVFVATAEIYWWWRMVVGLFSAAISVVGATCLLEVCGKECR